MKPKCNIQQIIYYNHTDTEIEIHNGHVYSIQVSRDNSYKSVRVE